MAASAVITFDTQAPVIDWGTPVRTGDTEVTVPYEFDEPASSIFVGGYVAGDDLPVTVYEDRVVISGVEATNPMLELAVTATDDVNNQRTWDLEFSVLDFVLAAKMYVMPVLRATGDVMAVVQGRIQGYPVLRGEGTLKPVLRAIMKIRKED